MRVVLIIAALVFCWVSMAEARRSLMDDVFSRPSEYTKNRMRVKQARADWKVQQYRAKMERSRIITNELRRQDYLRNKAHNEMVLQRQRMKHKK